MGNYSIVLHNTLNLGWVSSDSIECINVFVISLWSADMIVIISSIVAISVASYASSSSVR